MIDTADKIARLDAACEACADIVVDPGFWGKLGEPARRLWRKGMTAALRAEPVGDAADLVEELAAIEPYQGSIIKRAMHTLTTLSRRVEELDAENARMREALEGFVIELTSNLRNREKMLTINHAALVERIKIARAALGGNDA